MTHEAGQTKILVTVPEGPEIRFIPVTPKLARDVESATELENTTGAILGDLAETVRDVVAQGEALRTRTGAPPAWGAFLAIDRASRNVVGICSFTNAPDVNGAVEIAYFTFAPFERKGIATTMARFLVDYARARNEARLVYANTLPKEGPSARVLRRLGFAARGVAKDLDEGEVWRFELALEREDDARILRMERAALLSFCAGDPSGFLSICADDVTYFDPATKKRIEGKASLAAYFEKSRGKLRAERFEIASPHVVRVRDLAVLTFQFAAHGGTENGEYLNATEVYRRDPDGHRIVHRHWSLAAALT